MTGQPELAKDNSGAALKPHKGMFYQNFLEELTRKRGVTNHLEIGVLTGLLLSKIYTKNAYAVDLFFILENNVAANKEMVSLYQQTSDEFFATWNGPKNGKKLDFAMRDGMHIFEYLLRDFYNTESHCHSGSLIAIHDCLPLTAAI